MILDDPFEDFPALEDKNRCASPEPTDEILEVLIFNEKFNSVYES